MLGPGEYVADDTQGITRVEDLPKPKLIRRSRNYKRRPCPLCEHSAYRLRIVTRTLHDLGDPLTGRPRDIVLTYSAHRCPQCNHYFNADMDDLALPKSHYTHRVVSMAVRLVVAFMARPPSICPVGDNSELGGSNGGKKLKLASGRTTLTRLWQSFPAILLSMSYMMALSVYCSLWTTTSSSVCVMRFWIIILPMRI